MSVKSFFYFKNLLHSKWNRNNSIRQVPSQEEIQGYDIRGVWWPVDKTTTWYNALGFLLVRVYEGLCLPNVYGLCFNSSCKDDGSNLKCDRRIVDPYMGTPGLSVSYDQDH